MGPTSKWAEADPKWAEAMPTELKEAQKGRPDAVRTKPKEAPKGKARGGAEGGGPRGTGVAPMEPEIVPRGAAPKGAETAELAPKWAEAASTEWEEVPKREARGGIDGAGGGAKGGGPRGALVSEAE